MYQITDSILKSGVYSALTEPTREFQQRISFGEGSGANFIKHISFIKGITKIEISQEGNSDSSGLVLGSCCASSCVAEFYNPDRTYNYAGKTMFIECGVKYPFKVSYEDKTGGYYMTSNGKWVDGENVYSKVTNLIPVFEGDSFVYTGRGEWGAASVLWYDENKNFLSGEEYYSEDTRDHVTTVKIEAPDGAAWAVFQTFDYDSDVTLEVSKANDSFFYIPCGYYKVDKPETYDDWRTVSITAYDGIDEMTGKWNTSLSMPSNAYLLLEEIATRYRLALEVESGVLAEMKSRTVTEAQALVLTAYTEREVCGFLAGLFGANARINTVGKLAVKRYQNSPTDDFCVLAAVQWQNGFKKTSEEEFVVNSVTSGIDDAVFTAGTGAGISFPNPIITEDEISAVYDVYADVGFQPSSCEWRGNPCVECGDTVAVTDRNGNLYTVLVASQVIDLTGGLSMNTHCPGGDSEISFDTVDERTRAALNRQYTALQQAIIDASNALNGARGGYYEVLDNDNDGNPDGWLIKQFQDGSGGLMRANYEGIGLSLDGGKTYRTAIGFEGINADCITTGKLNAERIDTSTLVVGGNSYDSLDGLLNEIVDTANSSVTKVDVLYGKNQSATTPPSSWSTAAPTWQNGYYIWTKTQTTAGESVTETDPVCITGAKGETGATGSTGADGLGVSKIEEQYYLSTSNTTAPAENESGWSTNQPEWEKDKYIWTRSKITWSNNAVTHTTPSLAKAINGANSTAHTATNTANGVNTVLASLTQYVAENQTVVIKGGMIAAESIGTDQLQANCVTAEKIAVNSLTVGYQSGNLGTGWHNPNGLNFNEYFSVDGNKITLKKSYTSGVIRCSSQSLFLVAGEKVEFGGTIYNASANQSGLFLEERTGSTWTVRKYSAYSTTGKHSIGLSYDVVTSGEYRLTYSLDYHTANCYCENIYCKVSRDGSVVINGKIQSNNGDTYLNLDTGDSSLVCRNKNYRATFNSGCLKYDIVFDDLSTYFVGAVEGFYETSASARKLMVYAPNVIEIACANSAFEAQSNGLTMTSDRSVFYNHLEARGGFTNGSSEQYKTNISKFNGNALELIRDSVIYSFSYKSDKVGSAPCYGFIVERETPKEVLSDDKMGVELYSMASMNWKATQELLKRLEAVEKAVKINA